MIATTGQTWDQVRNDWDLPRLTAWTNYCAEYPTVRNMVHAYLGIKTEPQKQLPGTPDELLEMLAVFPGAVKV